MAFSLMVSLGMMVFMFREGVSLFNIKGTSMEPYLHNGDSVILKQQKTLEHGQIVFFNKPEGWPGGEEGHLLVKRVLALPGDKLSFNGRSFLVNGQVTSTLPADYICSAPEGFTTTLTNKQLFVVGDNVSASVDSRRVFCSGDLYGGFVGKLQVVDYGKIIMKF